MNPKRQRRPNVRLGEIGEVSAAFSCGILQKPTSGEKRQKPDIDKPREVYAYPTFGFSAQRSEFTLSDSVETQNRENWNPNSSKHVSEGACSDETDASEPRLGFGAVTRKGRLTNRRGRSVWSSGIIENSWQCNVTPGTSNEDGKGCQDDGFEEAVSDIQYGGYAVDWFKECLDHETLSMRKEHHEDSLDDVVLENGQKESDGISADDGNFMDNEAGVVDKMKVGGTFVSNIKGWLDGLGFGKYAGIFEMHEVDGEALTLLTFEDLKEMGINAVGTRRKLYTAIQLLKDGVLLDRSTVNK